MQPQLQEYLGLATQSLGGGLPYDSAKDANGVEHYFAVDGQTRILRGEFNKGVRAGILLVLDMPRASEEHYAGVAQELRDHIANMEKENG